MVEQHRVNHPYQSISGNESCDGSHRTYLHPNIVKMCGVSGSKSHHRNGSPTASEPHRPHLPECGSPHSLSSCHRRPRNLSPRDCQLFRMFLLKPIWGGKKNHHHLCQGDGNHERQNRGCESPISQHARHDRGRRSSRKRKTSVDQSGDQSQPSREPFLDCGQ